MAMTTQLPRGTANEPAATAAPPTGLPAEQLYTWLEWVQDDLRRLEARLDYLESARVQQLQRAGASARASSLHAVAVRRRRPEVDAGVREPVVVALHG